MESVKETISHTGIMGQHWAFTSIWKPLYVFNGIYAPDRVIYIPMLGIICCALMLLVKWYRPSMLAMALLIFLIHIRNPLLTSVVTPIQIWVLLFVAVLPLKESNKKIFLIQGGRLRHFEYNLIWGFMGVIYFASAISKLRSPPWVEGWALLQFREMPFFHKEIWGSFVETPAGFFAVWFVIVAEFFYFFAIVSSRLRVVAWFMILIVHLGILMSFSFSWLPLFMIIIQTLNFDCQWYWEARKKLKKRFQYILSTDLG